MKFEYDNNKNKTNKAKYNINFLVCVKSFVQFLYMETKDA